MKIRTGCRRVLTCNQIVFESVYVCVYSRAWSVGFMNFPLLVDEVDRRPMMAHTHLHLKHITVTRKKETIVSRDVKVVRSQTLHSKTQASYDTLKPLLHVLSLV